MIPAGRWLAVLAAVLLLPGAASASISLVINEIDYEQPGTDDAEFIELLNAGGVAEALGDLEVRLVDGTGPSVYTTIDLPAFSLPPGGHFVICSDATKVPNCDLVVSLGSDFIQDGAPDAVQLFKVTGATVIDTVSYEGDVSGFVETSGVSPADNSTDLFLGISRFPDGADTGDNSADLSPRCATPGLPNAAFTPDCRINATKVDSIVGDAGAPGSGDPGETIRYEIQIQTSGAADDVELSDSVDPNTTFVGGSVNVSPLARDDAYSAVGNTLLEVGGTPSGDPAVTATGTLFDNDTEFLGDTFSLSTADSTSVNGGTVSVATDGSFSYLPPVGFTGTDTFTYTIIDGDSLTGTGTVSVVVDEMVWYVDDVNGSDATGDGRSNDPFASLAPLTSGGSADGLDGAGDFIFVHSDDGATGNGIVLEAGQQLIGEGVALVVGSNTLNPAGVRPTLTTATAFTNAVDLGSGNTIRGLDVGSTTGTAFAGTSVGTVTMSDVAISGTGGAFDVDTGTLAVTLDSIGSTGTAAGVDGIDFDGVGGSFFVTGATSFTGTMGDGVNIQSSGGSFSFGSLSVTTAVGNGLVAKGGGTLGVTSAPTISAVGGAAVDLAGTTAGNVGGAAQWTFASLGSASSSGEGIKLESLGEPFTVTGSTTITDSSAEGIEIDGSSVAYSFGTTTITDAGDNGIDLNGLTGSFNLTSAGGGITFPTGTNDSHGVLIVNSDDVTVQGTNASNRFVISDAGNGAGTSSLTSTAEGFQGVLADDSGNLTLKFLDISGIGGQASGGGAEHGIFVSNPDNGSTVTITDNVIASIKNDGVEVLADNLTGTVTVDISDNVISGTGATTGSETTDFGIDLDIEDGSSSGRFVATIDGNSIDDVNSIGIGIAVFGDTGRGGAGMENRFDLDGNTIRDFDFDGIGIVILENSRNIITLHDTVIDGVVSPLGSVDPDRGINVDIQVLDLTTGSDNDFNTSETDLTISGSATVIRDVGDEGIQIRNFGDDEPSGSTNFDTNSGTAKVLIKDAVTVTGNGDQGLRVEAGLDGEIDLRVVGPSADFSGNDVGAGTPEDVLVGVRSLGLRTINSYLAGFDTTAGHQIRIESDNVVATTHQFGCGTGTCGGLEGTSTTSTADIAAILNNNGVTASGGAVAAGDIDLSLSGGDIDVVDESVIPSAAP